MSTIFLGPKIEILFKMLFKNLASSSFLEYDAKFLNKIKKKFFLRPTLKKRRTLNF